MILFSDGVMFDHVELGWFADNKDREVLTEIKYFLINTRIKQNMTQPYAESYMVRSLKTYLFLTNQTDICSNFLLVHTKNNLNFNCYKILVVVAEGF